MNEQDGISVGVRSPSAEGGEGFRWRPWPCPACGGSGTPLRELRRCVQTGAALIESIEQPEEVAISQSNCLLRWVAGCRHTEWQTVNYRLLGAGSEHLVFHDPARSIVWKLTRLKVYGDSYYLVNEVIHQKNDSPREYLMRFRLWKTVFHGAPKAVGITDAGQIVSNQSFILGSTPSQDAIDRFLEEAGLVARKKRFWLWKAAYPMFDIWTRDARPDNFVESAEGIVPIDLRLWISRPEASVEN